MPDLSEKIKDLGLNEKQSQAYLYILKNKRVNLKELAKELEISIPRISIITQDMIDKGFIKEVAIDGTRKIYTSTDIEEFRKQYLNDFKNKRHQIEQIFAELNNNYGQFSIKITRLSANTFVEKIKSIIIKSKEVFEFIDLRSLSKIQEKQLPEFKNIQYTTLFSHPDDDFQSDKAQKVKIDLKKSYAHILSFGDKTRFTTTNKETVLLENQEIANSIQFLISEIYNKNKTAE